MIDKLTPFRLILASIALGLLGGGFALLTFSLKGDAVFVSFLIGNALLALAGVVGMVGFISLAVEVGVRSAHRGDLRLVYDSTSGHDERPLTAEAMRG